jgi:hypothetical protein
MVSRMQSGTDGTRFFWLCFLWSLLASAALVAVNSYQFTHQSRPQYAVTAASGKVDSIQPYSSAMLTPPQLLEWAQRAIVASNTYDFRRLPAQLEQLEQYYSADGYDAFKADLLKSGKLKNVIDNRISVQAVATAPPTIVNQAQLNGRWVFLIQMPIMVQYVSDPTSITRYLDVTIRVQREDDTLLYPKGISVVNYKEGGGRDPRRTIG